MGRSKKLPVPLGPGKCRLCSRWEGVRTVCMEGAGPKNPELVLIGEAPAGTEDTWCKNCQRPLVQSCLDSFHQIGQPLVGPAGQIIRQALLDVGIDENNVYMTNSAKCGGKGSGNPDMTQVRKCVGAYLLDELASLDYSRCKGVVLLGETAVRGVLNNGTLKIRDARLRDLNLHTEIVPVPLRAVYHPAAALPGRNPGLYHEIVDDLRTLTQPRDSIKPVREIYSSHELDIFSEADVLGLDLEWNKFGHIRVVGISDGVTNLALKDPSTLWDWLYHL